MSRAADILLFSYGTLQLKRAQIPSYGRRLYEEPDAMARWKTGITNPDVLRQGAHRCRPVVPRSDSFTDEVPGMVCRISARELAAAEAYEVADYAWVEVLPKSGRLAWLHVKADNEEPGT